MPTPVNEGSNGRTRGGASQTLDTPYLQTPTSLGTSYLKTPTSQAASSLTGSDCYGESAMPRMLLRLRK